jgi:hypothetical protein
VVAAAAAAAPSIKLLSFISDLQSVISIGTKEKRHCPRELFLSLPPIGGWTSEADKSVRLEAARKDDHTHPISRFNTEYGLHLPQRLFSKTGVARMSQNQIGNLETVRKLGKIAGLTGT